MPEILLITVNARFGHTAFGLRYLLANMGDLREATQIREWSLGVRARDVVEAVLADQPRVVGLSVYIWNVDILTEVASLLKALAPEVVLVVGGPEVSHEWEATEIFGLADYLVRGEGDLEFARLCRSVLVGERPLQKVVAGGLPPLAELSWPYPHYTDFDLEHGRVLYVEASRGCPFQCHFCLSSLDRSVRAFELEPFLLQMEELLGRGVLQFKFVDRTFNLKASTSLRILRFFLERYRTGMFLHFEMIPDRLPVELRSVIADFAPGVLQFEVGIQSFDPEVCGRIGRRQNFQAIEDNLRFLARETGVHVHADLIAGLPGEDMASFGRGFDRLHALEVAEIQVGILKRLRGTPITLADPEWGMVYASRPPYEVLCTAHLSFNELQRLQRFARYWDLVANSGRFPALLALLVQRGDAFRPFLKFSDWLYGSSGQTHGISAKRLASMISEYLTEQGCSEPLVLSALESDLGRSKVSTLPERQARHAHA